MVNSVIKQIEPVANQLATYSQGVTNTNAKEAAILRNWQEQQTTKAQQFNAEQAALNREWQEYMSNTAHQREVKDLMQAGLNPVLSVTGGSGASVGSGSTASISAPSGASSHADNSFNNALVNVLGSVLGSMTSIANAATSANAVLGSASIASEVNELIAKMGSEDKAVQREHEEYMAKYYPTTTTGAVASATERIKEIIPALRRFINGSGRGGISDSFTLRLPSISSAIKNFQQSRPNRTFVEYR